MDASILIYGDSITHGLVPVARTRYERSIRWTGILQQKMPTWHIVEEGLSSRVLRGKNPYKLGRDGWRQYPAILASHLPLRYIAIMLGTNDATSAVNKSAETIANDMEQYLFATRRIAQDRKSSTPHIILMAPPSLDEARANSDGSRRFLGAQAKIQQLPQLYKSIAAKNGTSFFDASYIQPSEKDGVHLDVQANRTLGQDFATFLFHESSQ